MGFRTSLVQPPPASSDGHIGALSRMLLNPIGSSTSAKHISPSLAIPQMSPKHHLHPRSTQTQVGPQAQPRKPPRREKRSSSGAWAAQPRQLMAGTPQDCISLVIVSPPCLYKTSGHRHCFEVCLEDAAKVDAAPSAAKRGTHPSKNRVHPGKWFGPCPSASTE